MKNNAIDGGSIKGFGRFEDGDAVAKKRRKYFTRGETHDGSKALDRLRAESGLGHLFLAPRFDWYQVTFLDNVDPYDVLESAYNYFAESTMQVAEYAEVKQYARGVNVYHRPSISKDKLFHMCIGGSGGDRPHIKATGQASHLVYEWLSTEWSGSYAVSRADVCFDTTEPEMFRYLDSQSVEFATEKNITLSRAGDWDKWEKGATRYMGSKDSQAQCRIYEKGKQLDANPDWVRLEFQIRPSKANAKKMVASMTPEQVVMSVAWCASFLLYLMHAHGVDKSEYQQISYGWKQSNDQRTMAAFVKQYGGFLSRFVECLPGGWDDLGAAVKYYMDVKESNGKAKGGLGQNPYDALMSHLLKVS